MQWLEILVYVLIASMLCFVFFIAFMAYRTEKNAIQFRKILMPGYSAWFSGKDRSFDCRIVSIDGQEVTVEVKLKINQLYPNDTKTKN